MHKISTSTKIMVFALLLLGLTNAVINIQARAWSDLALSLGMIMVLIPLPENLRFITARLSNDVYRTPTVTVLHSLAVGSFLVGLAGKVI